MKKGVFEVPTMLFSFLFLVLLFFSYLLFVDSFDFKDKEFIDGMNSVFDEKLLLSYLQNSVSFEIDEETKEMEMIDLLVLWREDKNRYDDILKIKTNEILDNMEYEYMDNEGKIMISSYVVAIPKEEWENTRFSTFTSTHFPTDRVVYCFSGLEHISCKSAIFTVPMKSGSFNVNFLSEQVSKEVIS